MSDQPRPECCPTCEQDPKAAPKRYCASARCRCGHPACPAYASWSPLRPEAPNVLHMAPGGRVQRQRARAS